MNYSARRNLVTQRQLAEILCCSTTMIRKYVEAGAPVAVPASHLSDVRYDSGAFVRHLVTKAQQRATPHTSQVEAVRRLKSAQAELKEFELASLRKETLAIPDISDSFADVLVRFRSVLYEMPDRLAKPLAISADTSEISRLLFSEINTALAQLSGYDPNEEDA
jgi:phage terminase Nu1 subunit (DNA packaging protein)